VKFIFASICAKLVSLSCIAIAGYLALNDKSTWFWFLLAGLASYATIGNEK
jgi:hypothetical protein